MQMLRNKILIVALCLGAITSILVYVTLSKQTKQVPKDMQIVVAARDIPNGSIIDMSMLSVHSVQEKLAPADSTPLPDIVVGKIAKKEFKAGEPIAMSALGVKDRLSQMIPPFMRAVTVSVDPIIGVAGFIKPGDRVDIIATFNINSGALTKTVLQNVQLLATGAELNPEPNADPKSSTNSAQPQANATVAVSAVQAERLVLAESKGKLRLILRRADDVAYAHTKGITGRDLFGIVPPDVPIKQALLSAPSAKVRAKAEYLLPSERSIPPMMNPILPIPPAPAMSELPVPEKKVQVIRGSKVDEVVVAK